MRFGRYFDDTELCSYDDVYCALASHLCEDVIMIVWQFTVKLNEELREDMRLGYTMWWMRMRRLNTDFTQLRSDFLHGNVRSAFLNWVNYKVWLECELRDYSPNDSIGAKLYAKYPKLHQEAIAFGLEAVPERAPNSSALNIARYDLALSSMDAFTLMAIENALKTSATRYLFE